MDEVAHLDERCLVVMYHYVRDDLERIPKNLSQRRSTLKYGTKTAESHDQENSNGHKEAQLTSGIVGLTSAEFSAQVDWLCDRLEPVCWAAVSGWLEGRNSLPRRTVLFTFDDGLREHRTLVAPILEARNLQGIFFVPGIVLEQQRLLPAHAVHVLLSTLTDETLIENFLKHLHDQGLNTNVFAQLDLRAAETMYHYEPPVRAHLKYFLNVVLHPPIRDTALSAIFEEHVGSLQDWSRRWYLSPDDLTELHRMGHTIGGHGFSHEPLTRLSPSEHVRDFRACQSTLDDILGKSARPFSYPFGRHDEEVRETCRDAGFVEGFTTVCQWMDRQSKPFLRPRVDTATVEVFLDAENSCVTMPS
ncbi:MAG: polysaccharide deacetylase family protein [Planctomycetota bacterium]